MILLKMCKKMGNMCCDELCWRGVENSRQCMLRYDEVYDAIKKYVEDECRELVQEYGDDNVDFDESNAYFDVGGYWFTDV